MDRKTKKTFYGIWAVTWLLLSTVVLTFTYPRPGPPERVLDPGIWLSTFPIGWTVALVWLRNRSFFARPIVQALGYALFFAGVAFYLWDGMHQPASADHSMEQINAAVITVVAVLSFGWFLSLVPGALRDRQTRMVSGRQPLARMHVEP